LRILALDLATRFGYALWDSSEGLVKSGFGQLPVGGPPGKRFAAFHLALRGLAPTLNEIAYEDAWHQRGRAAAVFHGLVAMMQVHAYQVGATLHPLAVATIKKHATGSGRADKAEMMKAATARWGVECQTDDHGDALCVLSLHLYRKGGGAAKGHEPTKPTKAPGARKAGARGKAGGRLLSEL
jgi:Holliday junction resolvasome RuvABC endonuclease subunit